MKAAVMTEPGKLSIVEREIPQIKEDEVLVKIEHVGVCGSDLHYYEYGRIGDFVVEKPIVLGHEAAGKVVATGKKVKTLQEGDLVALEPGKTCGKCEFCKTGRYNLCPDVEFLATPPYDGAFVEYIAYPENMCFKLPAGMSTLAGALIEPLAVGFHAANQGVDIVIDAAGSKTTTQQTVELVKRGGRIVLVGMAANPMFDYDFGKLQAKEALLNTVFRYRNIYPAAIKAVGEKMIDVEQIVTDIFGFSEIKKALDYSIENKENTVKVVIDMNK